MTPTGTPQADDDLGARLRAALQEVTPLATDPVPPPRFAPDAVPAARVTEADADVLDLQAARPGGHGRHRRLLAGGALLTAAAAVVATVVLTTDLGRADRTTPAPPAATRDAAATDAPTADSSGTLPPGVVPGILVPWRCTAPAGATIAATVVRDAISPQVWRIGAGVTCAAYPADVDRFTIDADGKGVSVTDPVPATFGVSEGCVVAATQSYPTYDVSFVSRGEADYLEFFGDGCRLLVPDR